MGMFCGIESSFPRRDIYYLCPDRETLFFKLYSTLTSGERERKHTETRLADELYYLIAQLYIL